MAKNKENMRLFSCYVSPEIYKLMEFLREREEVTRIVFVRRAVRCFMESEHVVSERIRIKAKKDPDYIERGALVTVHMEESQHRQLKEVAKEQNCTMSDVVFQALLDYCAILISLDDTGLTWT